MTAQSSAAPAQQPTGRGRIRVGSAPDSWGVWFPDDPEQVPWQRFLDEVSACGYDWIELGPYGYLPTDPARLADELGTRGLRVTAGTVFEHLHRPDSWDAVWRQVSDVAALTRAMGGTQPVAYANVQLYAPGTTGYGSAATPVSRWPRMPPACAGTARIRPG